MPNDDLARFEAVITAMGKMTTDENGELEDARCPSCNGSSFASIQDLYSESAGRIEEDPSQAEMKRTWDMSDADIVRKFKPPKQRSAMGLGLIMLVVLGVADFFVYRYFGDTPAKMGGIAAVIILTMVVLMSARRFSDTYYAQRRRWRKTYKCRKCGQLIGT